MDIVNCEYTNQNHSFALSLREVQGYYTMPSYHFHDAYELYYLLSGKRYYFIEDRTFEINKGDLILIKPYALHKTTDAGPPDHQRLLLSFNKNFFPQPTLMKDVIQQLYYQNHNAFHFSSHQQQDMEHFLSEIINELQERPIGFEASIQSFVTQILIYLARHCKNAMIANSPTHPSPMHEKISEIVQYMNIHYMNPLTLSFISKHFFISQYYLSRSFKQVTGFTFIEYLNSVRIREAQRLLRETEKQVIQIAHMVGFNNISHFGRIFKAITKYTPLQYRKIYQ
ncbi:MAG: AraC family transcriptional regulator [Epulopiscium sp.]|nr:AraC family transcriptional regulator [Candidatus Epulonipiscium sp.]